MSDQPSPTITVTMSRRDATFARQALSQALRSPFPWDDEQRAGIIAVDNVMAQAADEGRRG